MKRFFLDLVIRLLDTCAGAAIAADSRAGERQTCPQRWTGDLPRAAFVDVWQSSQWHWLILLRDRVKRRHPGYKVADLASWPAGFADLKPRTCSHCDSVHPDDARRLLLAGWQMRSSLRPRVFFFEPPAWSVPRWNDSGLTPTPAVRLHETHISRDDLEQLALLSSVAVVAAGKADAPTEGDRFLTPLPMSHPAHPLSTAQWPDPPCYAY